MPSRLAQHRQEQQQQEQQEQQQQEQQEQEQLRHLCPSFGASAEAALVAFLQLHFTPIAPSCLAGWLTGWLTG
ncbi:hypothetical protein AWZ03_007217 [Drosophila navojoa]|uniref:Uncharacterized protein n=1 Tax=Drosophila navojoa TaxID=7232 RepID=A0A484BC89_DRONA|nr:hypothetical protein AWZ03_007217 [Drosophila navojoa]